MRGELQQLRALAAGCVDAPTWALADDDVLACLDAAHRLEQAVAAIKLHLVPELDTRQLPATRHATGTAVWLRERLRISISAARRLVELATATDRRPELDQALGAGQVNQEQAAVIVAAVAGLPAHVGAPVAGKAEATLIDLAGQFEPHILRRLGARILEHVAPDLAERVDAEALARDEARAHAARALTMVSVGDGRVRLSGWLDTEAAATVTAALDPLCAPRRRGPGGATATAPTDDRTAGQRRADALVEVCQLALHTGELPVNGGDRPQLTVTVAYDPLRRQLGAGSLDTGDRLTPEQVRRLACDAQVLPAVLGGHGQVLDLGQSRRLISGPLRRALVLRDRGCAFPGCDRPARWCHAHHIRAWADGGSTSLDNAVLLCGHHHRVIHQGQWAVRLRNDGNPEFLPPTYLEPHRRARRNSYHQRN